MVKHVQIEKLTERHIPQVAELLQDHLHLWRYPWRASDEELAERIRRSLSDLGGLYTERRRWSHWVAVADGRVLGAALTYADAPSPEPGNSDPIGGHIVWLLFRPDLSQVGDLLLEHAASWLGSAWSGASAFELANPLGWCAGLPPTWVHVREALLRHGFRPASGLNVMWGAVHVPEVPPATHCAPKLCITCEDRTDGFQLSARLGARRIGNLEAAALTPTDLILPWDGAWLIEHVEVDEPYRRRGVGKRLFHALAEELSRRGVARLVGYTESPAAIRLNEWVGMGARIAQPYFQRPNLGEGAQTAPPVT